MREVGKFIGQLCGGAVGIVFLMLLCGALSALSILPVALLIKWLFF